MTSNPNRIPPLYDPAEAVCALSADPALAAVFAAAGPPDLAPRADETADALARSVVYQQLSGTAAATIHGRVLAAVGDGTRLDPAAVLAAPDDVLRGAGLSRAKALALRDIAARALDGRLPRRDALAALPDDAVTEALVAVRGVGPWTAQMVMMFTLGRPDVWPAADLGVQEGLRLVRGLDARPTAAEAERLGEPFRPWRSAAAWAMWRAVDLARAA